MLKLYTILQMLIADSLSLSKVGTYLSDIFTGFGGLGVLLLAVGDSSFLSVPEGNDLLIVVLSTGRSWSNMAYFVCMTVIGSVIGCSILYSIGRKGGSALLRKKFSTEKLRRAEKIYSNYGAFAVLIPSILPPPLPFKIFVLSAGVFRMPPLKFISAVTAGRCIRYSMWGILAVLYGDSVKLFLENNFKTVGKGLFVALLIAAVGVLGYFIYTKNRKKQ